MGPLAILFSLGIPSRPGEMTRWELRTSTSSPILSILPVSLPRVKKKPIWPSSSPLLHSCAFSNLTTLLAPLPLFFQGKPCSGKGTQAPMICRKYRIVHISVGDLLRAGKPPPLPQSYFLIPRTSKPPSFAPLPYPLFLTSFPSFLLFGQRSPPRKRIHATWMQTRFLF